MLAIPDRQAWISYDWANSVISAVVISLFAPVLLVRLAETHAGAAHEDCEDDATDLLRKRDCMQCVPGDGPQLWDGNAWTDRPDATVPFFGADVSAVAFASTCIAISVVAQVVVFVSVGPMADYGRWRLRLLQGTTALGGLLVLAFLFVGAPGAYGGAGVLLILVNICFGVCIVFYNAFLPLLTEAHPAVVQAAAEARAARERGGDAAGTAEAAFLKTREDTENELSHKGFAWGYAGGVLCVAVGVGIQMAAGNTEENGFLGDRLSIAFAGLWWVACAFGYSFRGMRARPGPSLTGADGGGEGGEGAGAGKAVAACCRTMVAGWGTLGTTLKEARKIRNTWRFLLIYFVYSDGYGTISSVGVLYALEKICMPSMRLGLMVILINIMAAAGNLLFMRLQRRLGYGSKKMVVLNLACLAVLPVWGMLGFVEGSTIGLKSEAELYGFAVVYGLNLGSVQSYTRTLFCDLIPRGREAQFFSLYEITDKGSAFIGPAVVAAIRTGTGELRYAFVYLLVVMILPIVLLHYGVDEKQGMLDVGRALEGVGNAGGGGGRRGAAVRDAEEVTSAAAKLEEGGGASAADATNGGGDIELSVTTT